MRTLFSLGLFLLGAVVAVAEVDLGAALPMVALKDGRVLKRVKLSSFKTETVLLRHAAGMTVVRYEFLPQEVRVAAEQRRPGGPRILPGELLAPGAGQRVAGQVFITTVGAGSYKFSDVDVYAFPVSAAQAWERRGEPVELPKPLAQTKSDADGKFELELPPGQAFILFAQAERRRVGTRSTWWERFEWRAPSAEIKDLTQVNLAANWQHDQRAVRISEY